MCVVMRFHIYTAFEMQKRWNVCLIVLILDCEKWLGKCRFRCGPEIQPGTRSSQHCKMRKG
jgi:hypothetical protein